MKRYGKWDVLLPEDEKYLWEPDEVTLGEQLMIEQEWSGSYHEWITAIGRERAAACQILVWFLRRKDGRQEDRASVNFAIRYLDITEAKPPEGDEDPEAPAPSEGATSKVPASVSE